MDEEDLSGKSKELTQRIEELQKKQAQRTDDYPQSTRDDYVRNELERLKRETKELKKEVARLKKPPLLVGQVKELLPEDKAVIESSTGPDFIVNVADFLPNNDLKPGTRVALNKQTLSVVEVLPSSIDPNIMGAEVLTKPDITYENIGGLKDQIREVKETVEEPLLYPEKFSDVGVEPPKAVLLVGPPGTGKTMMAKAVANRTNATFIKLVGSELVQKYIGEGARMVRELFKMAREKSPSVIFIDELDSVATKRQEQATSGDREVQRTMMQLLSELDGFDPLGEVKIIGATNRPKLLDKALLRPGRFDRIIETPKPDYQARKDIFRIHMKEMNVSKDVDLDLLATESEEASGADIKAICTEAGMFSIRRDRSREIEQRDFLDAVEKVLSDSTERKIKKQVMYA
ncbi:MAG: proteasome-activating nucleotidase [Candidatus Thermoplasmatota archaeon]|nr:proteasome-activating nucleotidase [Candidatus Thermoplasmatota archaeon]MBS3790305.1 proteasome-activating nucleotidase [Candidatus Thermoplasmatota archaeon]